MSSRLTRRAALGGALGVPLASLPAGIAAAQGDGNAPRPASTGYFTVPINGILIGLLLPAVQKVRAPARLLLLDSAGKPVVTVPLPGGGPAFFDVFFGDGSVRVERRTADGSVRVGEGSSPDGILIGLLLPAVQRDGSSAGLLAGSVQLRNENGEPSQILPFIEQENVIGEKGGESRRAAVSFVGPFTGGKEGILIGLLLPAVQKVRQAHRFLLLGSSGKVLAQDQIIGPSDSQGSAFGVQYEIAMGDGSVRVARRTADGSVRVGEGASPDGILIGLLLPAVQAGNQAVGMLGGSLLSRTLTVPFQSLTAPEPE